MKLSPGNSQKRKVKLAGFVWFFLGELHLFYLRFLFSRVFAYGSFVYERGPELRATKAGREKPAGNYLTLCLCRPWRHLCLCLSYES